MLFNWTGVQLNSSAPPAAIAPLRSCAIVFALFCVILITMKETLLIFFNDGTVKWCDWIDFDDPVQTIILRRSGNKHRSPAPIDKLVRVEKGFRNEGGNCLYNGKKERLA